MYYNQRVYKLSVKNTVRNLERIIEISVQRTLHCTFL